MQTDKKLKKRITYEKMHTPFSGDLRTAPISSGEFKFSEKQNFKPPWIRALSKMKTHMYS